MPSGYSKKPPPRPRYTLRNSPAGQSARVLSRASLNAYIRQQVVGRATNTDAPIAFDLARFPVGAWFEEAFAMAYGHMVYQLTWVALRNIAPTELHGGRLDPTKHRYLEVYKGWLASGHQPPPVTIVESDSGELRLVDGHRRFVAALELRLPAILALVSFAVPGASFTPEGAPIMTGLTLEIALQDARMAGSKALTSAQWAELEAKIPELRKRAAALQRQPQ